MIVNDQLQIAQNVRLCLCGCAFFLFKYVCEGLMLLVRGGLLLCTCLWSISSVSLWLVSSHCAGSEVSCVIAEMWAQSHASPFACRQNTHCAPEPLPPAPHPPRLSLSRALYLGEQVHYCCVFAVAVAL